MADHPDERNGLSTAEARRRLQQIGPNQLPSERHNTAWQWAREIAREPMFLLLLATGVTYLLLGEPREALMLLVGIFAIMVISAYQQLKTDRALSALRDLSSPRALVLRDGQPRRIAARELVPGDIVLVEEGTRIPADGFVLSANDLHLDESPLTGEALPVRKRAWDRESSMSPPGGRPVLGLPRHAGSARPGQDPGGRHRSPH